MQTQTPSIQSSKISNSLVELYHLIIFMRSLCEVCQQEGSSSEDEVLNVQQPQSKDDAPSEQQSYAWVRQHVVKFLMNQWSESLSHALCWSSICNNSVFTFPSDCCQQSHHMRVCCCRHPTAQFTFWVLTRKKYSGQHRFKLNLFIHILCSHI